MMEEKPLTKEEVESFLRKNKKYLKEHFHVKELLFLITTLAA
jgi:hypothetical protein